MNDVLSATDFLNQLVDVESNQIHVLPSGTEIEIQDKLIYVYPGSTRLVNAKNLNCIFKFIERLGWKIIRTDYDSPSKDQDEFTSAINETTRTMNTEELKSAFYFVVVANKLDGSVVLSLDDDKDDHVRNAGINLSFSFTDPGIYKGRVEYVIATLVYLQMLEKAFELSNDANNEIVVVNNRLCLYFPNAITLIIINYL